MALREFRDSQGMPWRVWDIEPYHLVARPSWGDDEAGGTADEERGFARFRSGGTLNEGWLCFESDGAKRRLAPVPEGWQALEEAELERLLHGAQRVRRRGMAADV
ncbi:MAG TPA: hypothetical protein VFH27_16900 [Longimicrobiaceae bacterium]|nr:hypothetical protein [Longimicrobiaceae bacterium]